MDCVVGTPLRQRSARGGHEVQERTGSRITSSETLPMHEMAFALEKLGLYRSRTAVTAVKAALQVHFFVGSLCKTCACPEHNI